MFYFYFHLNLVYYSFDKTRIAKKTEEHLGETRNVADEVGRVGGHHDEQEQPGPQADPETNRKIFQLIHSDKKNTEKSHQDKLEKKLIRKLTQ